MFDDNLHKILAKHQELSTKLTNPDALSRDEFKNLSKDCFTQIAQADEEEFPGLARLEPVAVVMRKIQQHALAWQDRRGSPFKRERALAGDRVLQKNEFPAAALEAVPIVGRGIRAPLDAAAGDHAVQRSGAVRKQHAVSAMADGPHLPHKITHDGTNLTFY